MATSTVLVVFLYLLLPSWRPRIFFTFVLQTAFTVALFLVLIPIVNRLKRRWPNAISKWNKEGEFGPEESWSGGELRFVAVVAVFSVYAAIAGGWCIGMLIIKILRSFL